jgi:curved DNA-binding protein
MTVEFKDYYKILGVARNASAADIKKAYRKLARKFHPDVSKEKDAEVRFKEINEANEVLQDPEKRAAYDQLGADWQQGQSFRPPPGWGQGAAFRRSTSSDFGDASDFSEFFSSLFGRSRGGMAGRGGDGFRGRGQDHEARVRIDLDDSFTGATRSVSLRVPELDDHGGRRDRMRELQVRIPKGIREGQRIRLAGQGGPGFGGGQAGDLLLEVEFAPHRLYRVEGRDLHLTLPVAPWEAALGAKVKAPTPTGVVEVSVPKGSQPGRKLRLKGRGLPGEPPGDLYLSIEIVAPPADTPRARELYEAMAKDVAFDPRRELGV